MPGFGIKQNVLWSFYLTGIFGQRCPLDKSHAFKTIPPMNESSCFVIGQPTILVSCAYLSKDGRNRSAKWYTKREITSDSSEMPLLNYSLRDKFVKFENNSTKCNIFSLFFTITLLLVIFFPLFPFPLGHSWLIQSCVGRLSFQGGSLHSV